MVDLSITCLSRRLVPVASFGWGISPGVSAAPCPPFLGIAASQLPGSPPSTLRSCEFPHFRLDSVSSSSRTLWLPPCSLLAWLSFSAFSPDCTDCLSPFTRVLWPRVCPLFTIGCHFCCVESKRSIPLVSAPPSRGPSPSKSLLFPRGAPRDCPGRGNSCPVFTAVSQVPSAPISSAYIGSHCAHCRPYWFFLLENTA